MDNNRDNPLLNIERLRGRVLRCQERLNQLQDVCDAVHAALLKRPDLERWINRWQFELVEYEREQFALEQDAREQSAHEVQRGKV